MLEGTSNIAPLLENPVGAYVHWRHPESHYDWGHDFHRRGDAFVRDGAEDVEVEEQSEDERWDR
jgi:hypothetical protein